jgi:DNA-binding Lrp family transcriptional regulator
VVNRLLSLNHDGAGRQREAKVQSGVAAALTTRWRGDEHRRIAGRDAGDFERIHTDILTQLPGVSRVQSTLALRTVKKTTQLPI